MALKLVFLAALCIAQGFAFQPMNVLRKIDGCKDLAHVIPMEFEGTLHEMDEVRETVSMAAIDAYSKGEDLEIIIACFKEQRGNYLQLGLRISEMIEDGAEEIAKKLRQKAEKYAKLFSVPIRTIAITMRELPEIVYNFISNREFFKAIEAIRNARIIVKENSRIMGKIMQEMVAEVPEMADRVEEIAKDIRGEARKGMETIEKAFHKCVEEGGPKKSFDDE